MIRAMGSCASCGTEGVGPGQACPRCGALQHSGLELDVRARPAAKAPPPRKPAAEALPLELAVDPQSLVAERAAEAHVQPAASARVQEPEMDLAADARVLAEYGDSPKSWVAAPLYAWRVMRRQRELKTAHAARQVEAERAAVVLEDALVAFAESVRPAAEKQATYAAAIEDLARAEDVLRSRDKVLAAEQDAQKARLAQVDARLTTLEAELAKAQIEERLAAEQLSSTQGSLAREEAKLKRAESELQAARQREGGGPA